MTLGNVILGAGILILIVAMTGLWGTAAELAGGIWDVISSYFEQARRIGN